MLAIVSLLSVTKIEIAMLVPLLFLVLTTNYRRSTDYAHRARMQPSTALYFYIRRSDLLGLALGHPGCIAGCTTYGFDQDRLRACAITAAYYPPVRQSRQTTRRSGRLGSVHPCAASRIARSALLAGIATGCATADLQANVVDEDEGEQEGRVIWRICQDAGSRSDESAVKIDTITNRFLLDSSCCCNLHQQPY